MILADKIILHRKKIGLTQEELAAQLGVSRQSISKWEGAQSIPDIERIILLSNLFEVTVDYLLKDDKEEVEFIDSNTEEITRSLSLEEANKFLKLNEQSSKQLSLGIFLCITSSVILILFNKLYENNILFVSEDIANSLGLIVLILMVSVAVGLFIKNGSRMKPYDFLNNENIELQYGVKNIVSEQKAQYENTHTNQIIIGVLINILAIIVLFLPMLFITIPLIEILSIPLLILIIGIGTTILVKTSIKNSGYHKILQEEDYTIEKKKQSKIIGKIAGIYWLTTVTIFLAWSFISQDWGNTWIIWPIAGVVFGIVVIIVSLFIDKKS